MGEYKKSEPDSSLEITTIDISPLLDSDAAKESQDGVREALRQSCTSTGFFQIIGHGVPLSLQKEVIHCAKRFFDLPVEQKNEISLSKAYGHAYRGYEELGGQTSSKGGLPDLKEGFICDQEIPVSDPRAGTFLCGPNQWPASLDAQDFEVPLQQYRTKVVKVIDVLLKAMAEVLGDRLPSDAFHGFTNNPTAPLRLLHYPPQGTNKEQYGTGAHADVSCLTVLLQQAGTVGLQIWHEEKELWLPVQVIEDAFVVNVGDMLQGWTNGYFRSAQHRVINSGSGDRYSAPLFFMGNLEAPYKHLAKVTKANENSAWDRAGITEETTVGKYLVSRLQAVNSGDQGQAVKEV